MLFNSYEFILLFLPITLLVFYRIGGRGHHRAALAWLVGASLFFYGWWNPAYLGLIVASILGNYAFGVALSTRPDRRLLALGIGANLALLAYYKYANFFLQNLNALSGSDWHFEQVLLPLAISFFTFQQIAYLVDAWRGQTREYNFLHYCLFVVFFPQLIAGPIVHHREVLPQFARPEVYRLQAHNIAVGLTIFAIGLFKKVGLADNLAPYATLAFTAAEEGVVLSFFEAWRGALAYTFQLYFDFSGYSDMAIGLAALFGIRLPLNFDSPYKATSVIDFWKRWHITLSQFLRDYLYIPLGGNRKGPARRHVNLLITMLLGGLWHGAAWTFVLWGGLHGLFLVLNHGWRSLRERMGLKGSSGLGAWGGRLLTFVAVAFAWVLFRAADVDSALVMYQGMLGLNGVVWPESGNNGALANWLLQAGWQFLDTPYFKGGRDLAIIAALLAVVWWMPNTRDFLGLHHPVATERPARLRWQPSAAWAAFVGIVALLTLLQLARVSEFLYFRF